MTMMIQEVSPYVREWWKWILQTPASRNPAYGYSQTELPSASNQPFDYEDIWFLAGAANDGSLPFTRNLVHRSVFIPPNKSLFMSPMNFFAATRKKKHFAELEKRVKDEMDVINPESLYVMVDNKKLDSSRHIVRADSGEIFEITVDGKDNILHMINVWGHKIKLYAKGDGFWLFLKPFEPGTTHEIHTFGSCLAGKIQIEILYKIEVMHV